MSKQPNFYKQMCKHDNGNYLPISNEIIWRYKIIDGERVYVPGDVLGLYMRLIFSTEEFHFNLKSLSKLMGYSMEKTRKCVNTLIELGYLRRYQRIDKGRFTTSIYVIVESIDGEIDWEHTSLPNSIEIEEISESELPNAEKPSSGIPECGKPNCGKQNFGNPEGINNNNIDNKNKLNNKNINVFPQLFSEEKSCLSFSGLKIKKEDINMDTCNMDAGTDCSSNLMYPKEKHEDAAKKRRGGKIKNKVQQMEIEKGDSIRTIDTQGFKNTMAALSEDDNCMSRLVKQMNIAKEMDKQLNKSTAKSMSNMKVMKKHAAKVIQDVEVLNMMEDYLDTYIPKFGVMSKATFDTMWGDLQKDSNGDKTIILEALRNSIKNGYRQIYIPKSDNKYIPNVETYTPKIDENIDASMYELATDENGNPLTFG